MKKISNYLDDILIACGCVVLAYGAYLINPIAALFLTGIELIALGVLIGMGNKK